MDSEILSGEVNSGRVGT